MVVLARERRSRTVRWSCERTTSRSPAVWSRRARAASGFKRRGGEYGARVGATALNYFDVCRMVLGDVPEHYLCRGRFAGRTVIATPGNGRAAIASSILSPSGGPTGGVLSRALTACSRALIWRGAGHDRSGARYDRGRRYWRAQRTVVEDLQSGRKTEIATTRRELSATFPERLDEEALRHNKPGGWSWN